MCFKKKVGEELPTWQHIPLLTWKSRQAIHNSYKQNLDAAKVSFNHITHLRWSGIEQASRHGMVDTEISTMSGHIDSKIQRVYLTNLYPKLMKVMAGFRRDDQYFIARSKLPYGPYANIEEAITKVFPESANWKEQQKGVFGDTDKSAENFFQDLLPYFTRVILQDGPLWLKNYPKNEYSRNLRRRLGQPYVTWANWAISEIQRKEQVYLQSLLPDLNQAAQGAFMTMTNQTDRTRQEVVQEIALMRNTVLTAMRELDARVKHLSKQMRDLSNRTEYFHRHHAPLIRTPTRARAISAHISPIPILPLTHNTGDIMEENGDATDDATDDVTDRDEQKQPSADLQLNTDANIHNNLPPMNLTYNHPISTTCYIEHRIIHHLEPRNFL